MIIGIDIDNTITNTFEASLKYLKIFDNNYDDWHKLSLDKQNEFLNLYIDNIMEEATLKEGVNEAFKYLKEHNYKIILITARNNKHSLNTKDITIKYLEENQVIYDKIIFDDDNLNDKGTIAKKEKINLFIDDKDINLDRVSKYGIECLKFTYQDDIEKNNKYKTFTNWYDIIEYIKRKE